MRRATGATSKHVAPRPKRRGEKIDAIQVRAGSQRRRALSAKRAAKVSAANDYTEGLSQRLRDKDYAAAYLAASIQEGLGAFLVAVGDVMRARGFSHISSKAALNREHLYRAFSKTGNPSIETLWSVLDAVDLRLTVEPQE